MRNINLRGIDKDLARQTKEAKKLGGPSDALKKIMKRPGKLRNGEGSGLMHTIGIPLPTNKCKCGKIKFKYQKVCSDCYWKKYEF